MKASVAIIIPTYNQPKALYNALYSIVRWTRSVYRIYVVDNSVNGYAKGIAAQISSDIVVLKADANLGWMGGINLGVANSTEDYVLFLNDDVKILNYDTLWLQKLLAGFMEFSDVGAVVPTSNAVLGMQGFMNDPESVFTIVPVVSGLCMLLPRKAIHRVGELDEKLSGGDDLDYSLRLRNAGYKLVIRNDVFIYHFGSLTGGSIYGSHWNSAAYRETLTRELIIKHGFKNYLRLNYLDEPLRHIACPADWEKQVALQYCQGSGIEIGCGGNKITPDVVGIDITPKGNRGQAGCQIGRKSEADITVTDYLLPIPDSKFDFLVARHVLEHIVDDIGALKEWIRVVRHSGLVTIIVPDEAKVDGMPLDPTHKHAYTLESLKTKLDLLCKYEIVEVVQRDISLVLVVRVIK